MENTNLAIVTAKYNSLPVEITKKSFSKKEWRTILKEATAKNDNVKLTLAQFIEDKVRRSSVNAKNTHDKIVAYGAEVQNILPKVSDKYVLTVYPLAQVHSGNDVTFLQGIAKEAKKCIDAKKDASRKVNLFVRKSDGSFRQIKGGTFFNPKELHVSDLVEIEKLVLITV